MRDKEFWLFMLALFAALGCLVLMTWGLFTLNGPLMMFR